MGKISESLKKYLESVSDEELQKNWEEVKELNLIGPTIDEFLEMFPLEVQNKLKNKSEDNK